jgi:hypothetical protein
LFNKRRFFSSFIAFGLLLSFLLFVLASEIPMATKPHLLQLRATLYASENGFELRDSLWLTEEISERAAETYMRYINRYAQYAFNPFRLQARDEQYRVLAEAVFNTWQPENEIFLSLVLPPGTVAVVLLAPDGSYVNGASLYWQSEEDYPLLSNLSITPNFDLHREVELSWEAERYSEDFTVWYSSDGLWWELVERTADKSAIIDLFDLPGGVLPENQAEFLVTASNGLATSTISIRYDIPWHLPTIAIRGVRAGQVLQYDRNQTIGLVAVAWDYQERFTIYERVLWTDALGSVIFRGPDLELPASRFPIGRYNITAWTMNNRGLFAGQEIILDISALVYLYELLPLVSNQSGVPIYPLRTLLEACGWGVRFNVERQEIEINSYFDSFLVTSNGDLWLDGFFLGQLNLVNIFGQNHVDLQVLELFGIYSSEIATEDGFLALQLRIR